LRTLSVGELSIETVSTLVHTDTADVLLQSDVVNEKQYQSLVGSDGDQWETRVPTQARHSLQLCTEHHLYHRQTDTLCSQHDFTQTDTVSANTGHS